MSVWKRLLLFLSIFLVILFAVCFPFRRQIPSWIATLEHSWNDLPYLQAACGTDDLICAARKEKDGRLELRFFDPAGSRSAVKWETVLPKDMTDGELRMVYPVGSQCAYLGFYEEDARYLSLYRVRKGEPAERLMHEECAGDNTMARKNSLAFSTVTRAQETVSFALLTGDTVRVVSCGPDDSGVTVKSETERNGALSAVSLPDSVYIGTDAQMKLTFAGSGLFYVDGKDLNVYYSDLLAEKAPVETLELDGTIGPHQLTSLSLMQDGSALLLLDGHILQLVRQDGIQDLTDELYPNRGDCVFRMTALVAGALILSMLLWWHMVVTFRRRLPIALYWGVVSFALFAMVGVVFFNGMVGPLAEQEWMDRRTDFARDVVQLRLERYEMHDNALPDVVSHTAEAAGSDQISGLRVFSVHRNGENWYLTSGIRAELAPGVNVGFLEEAADQGSAAGRTGDRFWYSLVQGDNGLVVSFYWNDSPVISQIQKMMAGALAILSAVAFLILVMIGHDVRETARGLERYAKDREWKPVQVTGGDELEGMASTLNSMASDRREEAEAREREVTSYRRFVPEQILKLLGKQSVLEIDKSTLVSRQMVVMRVSFTFPEPVYTGAADPRLLFDSVNQVIERTAPIVRKKGGTVFNYEYYGYDVVMERDPRRVISAAVAVRQEVLSLNQQRAQDGLPAVDLRIAADVGEVIMGIVGDQDKIEPSTMSDSFSALEELIWACRRVEASILCTEAIASGLEGYGSRYMGKCTIGRKAIRVYEVFDGDPYSVRKGKEAGVRQFTEGVLSLYSGEIPQAKRIFLELVRHVPQDGGARYYLYLADRLAEKGTAGELSLNGRMESGDDKN